MPFLVRRIHAHHTHRSFELSDLHHIAEESTTSLVIPKLHDYWKIRGFCPTRLSVKLPINHLIASAPETVYGCTTRHQAFA